jgi:hypothetical protein
MSDRLTDRIELFVLDLADQFGRYVHSLFQCRPVMDPLPHLGSRERYIADTFCTRARRRVERQLDQIEENDDERIHSIARLTYRRGGYGLSLSPS